MNDRVELEPESRPLILRLLPLMLIAGAAGLVWWSGLLEYVSLQQLAENRETLRDLVSGHLVLALLTFMVAYTAVVAMSLPVAAPLTLTGGFLFGGLTGGMATVVSATLGAVIIFLLARTALAGTFARKAGPLLGKFRAGFQDNAISYLLFLRLVPLFPFWLVNLAPALLGVKLRDFVVATFVGIIPGSFAFALTGAGLDSVLAAQISAFNRCRAQSPEPDACAFELDPSSLVTPEMLAAFAALGVAALIPVLARRFWKKKPDMA